MNYYGSFLKSNANWDIAQQYIIAQQWDIKISICK
jgi:hypothetical protein